ncbi:unnamed protein product [Chrysoparadoxa australica]
MLTSPGRGSPGPRLLFRHLRARKPPPEPRIRLTLPPLSQQLSSSPVMMGHPAPAGAFPFGMPPHVRMGKPQPGYPIQAMYYERHPDTMGSELLHHQHMLMQAQLHEAQHIQAHHVQAQLVQAQLDRAQRQHDLEIRQRQQHSQQRRQGLNISPVNHVPKISQEDLSPNGTASEAGVGKVCNKGIKRKCHAAAGDSPEGSGLKGKERGDVRGGNKVRLEEETVEAVQQKQKQKKAQDVEQPQPQQHQQQQQRRRQSRPEEQSRDTGLRLLLRAIDISVEMELQPRTSAAAVEGKWAFAHTRPPFAAPHGAA